MPSRDDRIEELITASIAGELTPKEREELDHLRGEHPWIDDEISALSTIDARLRQVDLSWEEPTGIDTLRKRILSQIPTTRRDVRAEATHNAPVSTRTRRRWMTPLVAAACLVVGVAVGVGVPALASLPRSGPPGTLGAVEPVDVRDEVPGIDANADLVAHTWGTEAVLDITGLEVGETYAVVFIDADGTEFSAGEMLGSMVPIHCRLNAAVLRPDAVRLEIRDAAAEPIAVADLPRT